MIRRPPPLPDGVCLTDVWAHLPLVVKLRWLDVVQGEALAVRKETAAARQVRRSVMLTAEEGLQRRRDILERECRTFRVGRPRRRPSAMAS